MLVPILNAYPATGLSPIAEIQTKDQFSGSGRQLDHENSAMLRFDHHFSARRLRLTFASTSTPPIVMCRPLKAATICWTGS